MSRSLWRQRLAQARKGALIVQGEPPIWQALSRCGGFTPLCLQLIRTGESVGALDQDAGKPGASPSRKANLSASR